jgi:hypothetical protein
MSFGTVLFQKPTQEHGWRAQETEPEKSGIIARRHVGPPGGAWQLGEPNRQARGSILRPFTMLPADGAGKTVSNLIIWPHNINQIAACPDFTKLTIFHRCSSARQLPPGFELGGLSNADCGLKVWGEGATPGPTPHGDRS